MRSATEADLLALVRLAYTAAARPAAWMALLERYAQVMSASCVWLMSWDRRTHQSSITAAIGAVADPSVARDYNAYYGAINPLMRHGITYMRPGAVTLSHVKYPAAKFLRTEFYQDFAKRLGVAYSHAICLSISGDLQAHVSCIRSLRSGPYDWPHVRFARLLAPHLQRALHVHQHLRTLDDAHSAGASALDHLAAAVFIVTRDSRVLLANAAGQQMLKTRDGIDADGQGLRASLSAETSALRVLIARTAGLVSDHSFECGGALRLSRPALAQPLIALVVPMTLEVGTLALPPGCVMVLVHDPDASVDNGELLGQLYRLTRSEAAVAERLLIGESISDTGDALGMSQETVRTHLKAIFRKSGARGQAAFVRVALSSLAGRMDRQAFPIPSTAE